MSPGINIASGRPAIEGFVRRVVCDDRYVDATTTECALTQSTNISPLENEINASQAGLRDHGHVRGSKGRKRCLLPAIKKWLFSFHHSQLFVWQFDVLTFEVVYFQ